MYNILTVDLEDWFHATLMQRYIQFGNWECCESYLEESTNIILNLLNQREVKATFFILGWVAERYPDLILKVRDAGHELATHGYNHRLIYDLTQEEFKEDLKKAKRIIEDLTGTKIIGFRAPSWSINQSNKWAHQILEELQFRYDSSISRSNIYSKFFNQRKKELNDNFQNGQIFEIFQSTIGIFGNRLPCAGGFFLRLYPYWLTKLFIKRMNSKGQRAVVYFHPWEIRSPVPKIKIPLLCKFLQWYNVSSLPQKLNRLLSDFKFASIKQIYFDN